MLKRFALPIAFVLAAGFAHADKKALISEMIKLSETDKQIEQSFSQISKNPPNPFKDKFGDDQKKFDDIYLKTVKEELERITKDVYTKVIDQLNKLYDKHFTEEELTQIVNFMKSPAGLKQKTAMPKVMDEMSQVMRSSRETVMPAMQEALKKGMEAAKKQGVNPSKIDELLQKREDDMKKQQEMMEKFKKMQEEKANSKNSTEKKAEHAVEKEEID